MTKDFSLFHNAKMKSMTGYGASQIKFGSTEISVTVKSVNGRFLDVRSHLPKDYFQYESQIKKNVGQLFRRGTVDIFIHRRGSAQVHVELNKELVKKWLQVHKKLAQMIKEPADKVYYFEKLAAIPQIFEVQDSSKIDSREKTALFKALQGALKKCEIERVREGQSAKKHIQKMLKDLHSVVEKMKALRVEASQDFEARIKEKVKRLGLDESADSSRFSQELVMYIDKSDIAEELARLDEHIRQCGASLKIANEIGKKLDFYSQELLREVNTVGSKANYARLTEQVVNAKGLIEAIKEQVQNIE